MSEANRVGLRFIEEVTWNTTPATPTMQAIRFTGENLGHAIDNTQSQEIRDDRNVADTVQTLARNQGGFDFELSCTSFDNLMEGALFNTWATDVLKNGTTKKFFTIEKAALDEDEFFNFSGQIVSSMSMTVAASSIVTGRFDFMGSDASLAQTTGAAAVTAPTTTEVCNSMADVGTIQEGASLTALTGVFLQEISFTVNNNLRTIAQIGSNSLGAIPAGSCEVTGTLNMYFNSDRIFDQFKAGTASALTFTVTDAAGNSYTILFPRIKFETDEIVASGINTDVWENVSWRALYDQTEACAIKITRVVV
jgi:hypothetical protein